MATVDASFYAVARQLLRALGIQPTATNTALLVAWEYAEKPHTPSGVYQFNNPLNVTLREAGSISVNAAGVQQYPTLAEGLQANAQVIRQYPTLYEALEESDPSKFFGDQGMTALAIWSGGYATPDYGYANRVLAIYQTLTGGSLPVPPVLSLGPLSTPSPGRNQSQTSARRQFVAQTLPKPVPVASTVGIALFDTLTAMVTVAFLGYIGLTIARGEE